jgi:hypothetical protein
LEKFTREYLNEEVTFKQETDGREFLSNPEGNTHNKDSKPL